jgi:hypothetical protein
LDNIGLRAAQCPNLIMRGIRRRRQDGRPRNPRWRDAVG